MISLLIYNLEACLERDHGQMDFYLIQVIFGYGVFNAFLFYMRLSGEPGM